MPARYAASVAELLLFDRVRDGLNELDQDAFDRAVAHKLELVPDYEEALDESYDDGHADGLLEAEGRLKERIAEAESAAYKRGFADGQSKAGEKTA